ncbi:hypothetical protein K443DRAFT_642072, partial [Laccaria amethystina LaAM-08-1]
MQMAVSMTSVADLKLTWLWCRVWDTLCPYLDIIYVYIQTCPKTDIRSSKNRHKPSFTRRGHTVT